MHMNEVCPDGAPKVLVSTWDAGEGRLRLLGGRLRQLPSASQKGGDPPDAHVPPSWQRRLMGDGHRWLGGSKRPGASAPAILQGNRRASAAKNDWGHES